MYKLGTKGFNSSWPSLYVLLSPSFLSLPPSDEKVTDVGVLEADKEYVREDPLSLPDKFSWDDINLSDSAQVPALIRTNYHLLPLFSLSASFLLCHFSILTLPLLLPLHPLFPLPSPQLEELYVLLSENYVEDDDNMFRFDYGREFIRWALQPPGWRQSWHCGIRATTSGKLVGFISAVPAHIRVKEQ